MLALNSIDVLQVVQLQLVHRDSYRVCCESSSSSLVLGPSELGRIGIGIQFIFLFNSMLAWTMRTRFAINLIEKWSYDYIKMDCEDGKCYGVLAVSFVVSLLCGRRY